MIQIIRVAGTGPSDPRGDRLYADIVRVLNVTTISAVRTAQVYYLEGVDELAAARFAAEVLANPLTSRFTVNASIFDDAHPRVEVAYKPGVMNPETASILKAAQDLKVTDLVAADSATEYQLVSDALSAEDLARICGRLLVNPSTQRLVREPPVTLLITGTSGSIQRVPIRVLGNKGLMELSKDKLFLNLEEMLVIQEHFRTIDRDPTDAELETLAQTWSEHCGHKTFNARLFVNDCEKPALYTRLKDASRNRPDLVVSSFHDNSGVIRLYDDWAVCGKVETHNSPSALDPYGGAATGSGGVFRDIMGTGQGAETILSTDMFCLAPPTLPETALPPGCLHPEYLMRHVVRGVRDYGNRMGIPTGNGSFHFHPDCRAKPTVIVGAYGRIPMDMAAKGEPRTGDVVIAVGGRTGRDGIHGATFSSAEMTDRTATVNATAVQIGNPIEQKRMFDALIACRDAGYIRAITDCGAGGFSSAIGEMGSKTGVRVDLGHGPLKYPGLMPWEIWVSESQERMVLAVDPAHVERVLEMCRGFNVEATVLGEFTDDRRLTVTYDGASVCDLSMEFLHEGLPQRTMHARFEPAEIEEVIPDPPADANAWRAAFLGVMSHLNVCSREPVVRQYDHGVQGMSALPSYGGVQQDGPNDAVVLRPIPGKPYGLVVSHGLNPVLNRIDPYAGSMWALVEALSNLTAVGGNPDDVGLIDNFIWPFPDEESLWALDRSVDACVDFARAMNLPFVSGKDSLSSTYRGKDGTVIKIPPVLCISCFGRIPDVEKTVSADFKRAGESVIVVRGSVPDAKAMGGSAYYDVRGGVGGRVPSVELKEFRRTIRDLHKEIVSGRILACHDVSEGGIAVALAEMCIGGDCGATIDIELLLGEREDLALWNETPGQFLIEKMPDKLQPGLIPEALAVIGETTMERVIRFMHGETEIFSVSLDEIKAAWKAPLEEVFR